MAGAMRRFAYSATVRRTGLPTTEGNVAMWNRAMLKPPTRLTVSKGRGRRTRIRPLPLLALVVAAVLGLAYLPAAAFDGYTGPVTLRSTLALPEGGATSVHGVVLAGLGTTQDGFPDQIALVWTKQEAAFIPTWVLQLHSRQELLPVDSRLRVTDSRTFGTKTVTLATVTPRWGATYDTELSFDPGSGALSLRVRNVTEGTVVYQGDVVMSSLARAEYFPIAGLVAVGGGSVDSRFAPAAGLTVDPVFLPLGVKWGMVQAAGGQPESVYLTRLERDKTRDLGIRLDLASPVEGTFDFWVSHGSERILIARVEAPRETVFIPVPQDRLPVGEVELIMEYRLAGQVWLTESIVTTVGSVRGEVSLLRFDHDAGRAGGTLTIRADALLPETEVRLRADLYRMVWNKERMRYDRILETTQEPVSVPLALDEEAVSVPFAVSAPPAVDAASAGGLWEVRFRLETPLGIPVFLDGQERLFSTYRPATIAEGEPFIIAVIPDSQYYTLEGPQGGHPDMFVRQTEWLAAHAVELNIGLVLHVGDITQLNAPNQWEVAQKSITLLDGVIPYVLTIGNHDLGDEKGESRHTRLNTYFPPARYEQLPTFGGLLEPGALENSYHRFELGGRKYLVIALEFLPRLPALQWANEVAAAHPDHEVIILTHTYTGANGQPRTAYGSTPEKGIEAWGEVHTGYEIWNLLVRRHENIFMVLSGHIHHDTVPRRIGRGDHGNLVFELLFCYQGSENGGNGWLGLMKVYPKENVIGVTVYSPTRDEEKRDNVDGFPVPFCIDVTEGVYRRMDASCAIDLPLTVAP